MERHARFGAVVATVAMVVVTAAAAAPATVSVDSPATVERGGSVTVSVSLTNTGDEASAYIIDLSIPSGWTVTEHEDDGGTWKSSGTKWLWQTVEPGATVEPSVTLAVPDDATSTYSVQATAKDSTGTVDTGSTTLEAPTGKATATATSSATRTATETETSAPTATVTETATETAPPATETPEPTRTATAAEGGGGVPVVFLGGMVLLVGILAGGLWWGRQNAAGFPAGGSGGATDGPVGAAESEPSALDRLDEARSHADTAHRRRERGDLEGALEAWEDAIDSAEEAWADGTDPEHDEKFIAALNEFRSERDAIRDRQAAVEEVETEATTGERRLREADEALEDDRPQSAATLYRQARDRFQDAIDHARRNDLSDLSFTAEGHRVREIDDLEARRDLAERSRERAEED